MDYYHNEKENNFLSGISTGLATLDTLTQGWQAADLHIIAGASGMGCSSLVITTLLTAARHFNVQVAFFSLQMPRQKVLTKLISIATGLAFEKIARHQLSSAEQAQVQSFAQEWDEFISPRVQIIDVPGLTVCDLAATATQLRATGTELFFVDTLHRLTLDKHARSYCINREQEIAYLTRQLKTLALEKNVPVVVTAELSRAVTDRGGDKKPQLSDLRDSNVVANEADTVIFIYRAEVYRITEDEMGNPTQGVAELHIAKNRFAATDTATVRFVADCGRFEDAPVAEWTYHNSTVNSSSTPFPTAHRKHKRTDFGDAPF